MENRRYFFIGLIALTAFVFTIRLLSLQILDDTYRSVAEENIIQRNVEPPFRGLIFDRNGKVVTENQPAFNLMVIPRNLKDDEEESLKSWLGFSEEDFETKIQKAKRYSYYKPSVLAGMIPLPEFSMMQTDIVDYHGLMVKPILHRQYPHKSLSAALGYVAEIDKNRLEREAGKGYEQGDLVGISGLELEYEEILRGQKGVRYEMVNVKGEVKGQFKEGDYDSTAIPGKDIQISVDLDLQAYAEWLMEGKKGSVVAIEPSSGEILTFLSAPYYDPNMLSGRAFGANYTSLVQDTSKPLFNRPLMAAYPPGSIFKLVQALIGMQEGVIFPSTRITCNRLLLACHGAHTYEDLQGAIQYSCNPYFREVFRRTINQKESDNTFVDSRIGYEKWKAYVNSFGFGHKLGIDLPNEKDGIIVTPDYYDKIYGKHRWKFSTIYSLAIGQGEISAVPIQMANLAATLANRGHYYIPHFLKSVDGSASSIPEKYQEPLYTMVDTNHFQVVIDAMEKVVESGTGFRAKVPETAVCGKTGTAENPHGEDHSVFVAFAPKDNPKIAISVFVENSGQGARAAAGIAGLVMEKYLLGEIKRKYLEDYIRKGEFIY